MIRGIGLFTNANRSIPDILCCPKPVWSPDGAFSLRMPLLGILQSRKGCSLIREYEATPLLFQCSYGVPFYYYREVVSPAVHRSDKNRSRGGLKGCMLVKDDPGYLLSCWVIYHSRMIRNGMHSASELGKPIRLNVAI